MSDCKGILGRVFGHKFQPRYNTKKSSARIPERLETVNLHLSLEKLRDVKETYIGDVCIRCGEMKSWRVKK